MLDLTVPARLPEHAEVVVIGGGITGLAVLRLLRDRQVNAVLLERGRIAEGATGRSAGFVAQGTAGNYARAIRLHGREKAREVWRLGAQNHELLASLLPLAHVRYLRRGCWSMAADRGEADELEISASLLQEDGFAASWIPAPERLSAARLGALLTPHDAELDPGAAARALAESIGPGAIHERAWVEGVDFGARESTVYAGRGSVRAGSVVLATNAWTAELAPLAIAPHRGQMLATAPLSTVVAERPVHSHHGYRYWRQLLDGRLLLGGYRDEALEEEATTDAQPSDQIQSLLDRHLRQVLGVTAEVTHRWAGIMGFTGDGLPLVGRVPDRPGGYVAAGYSGQGLSLAFSCAALVADLLIEGRQPPDWLAPERAGAVSDPDQLPS